MRTTKRSLLPAALLVPLVVLVTVALAGPASADVPVGWDPEPEKVNPLHAVLVLGLIPLLAFIVIAVAVYVPSLVRGERLAPGTPVVENQWLGGPRRGVKELTGAGEADADAGGASARW